MKHKLRAGVLLLLVGSGWLLLTAPASLAAPPAARKKAAPTAGAVSPTTAAYRRTRDPFSPFPVTTTDALVRLVRTNARVRGLYARHFGVSEARITDFVSNALSLQRLPRTRQVTSYCARPDGTIYVVRTRLKAGEFVWATRSGLPILRWICSNPLTPTLPGTRVPKATTAKTLLSPKKATFTPESVDEEPVGMETALAQEPEDMSQENAEVPVVMPVDAPAGPNVQALSGRGTETVALRNSPPTGRPLSVLGSSPRVSGNSVSLSHVATVATAVPVVEQAHKIASKPPATTVVETRLETPPHVLVDPQPGMAPMITPEPGTGWLIGGVLPTLWALRRRRRARK